MEILIDKIRISISKRYLFSIFASFSLGEYKVSDQDVLLLSGKQTHGCHDLEKLVRHIFHIPKPIDTVRFHGLLVVSEQT